MIGEQEYGTIEILDVLSRLVHREILKLLALGGIAIVAFFLTRIIAANNRATTRSTALIWFQRGQHELSDGDVQEAISSFRHARLGNRDERTYSLALARALAANRDTAGAHQVLLEMRRDAPEDPEVNLALARLAAQRRDIPDATRYYQYALYAPATAAEPERRQQVRLEMIRFLLSQRSSDRAIPELIALSNDLPLSAAARLGIARLFAQAGDQPRALAQFDLFLRQTPQDSAALAGAARAAFDIGDYARSARYVRRMSHPPQEILELSRIANWVLSSDPLAARIPGAERRRRLADNYRFASERLRTCLASVAPQTDAQANELASQSAQFKSQHAATQADSDAFLESGVDLTARIARFIADSCAPATARDSALILIGERHRAEPI